MISVFRLPYCSVCGHNDTDWMYNINTVNIYAVLKVLFVTLFFAVLFIS